MYLDRPIGIDLGTTNSAVALLEPDGRDLLIYSDRLRRRVIPSIVGFNPNTEDLIVGFPAWNRRGLDPEPILSIKRKMGRKDTVKIGPNEMTPEEVSAEIVRAVRENMHTYASERLEGYSLRLGRAVITVPAYFDAPQIEATRRAGELAGVEVLSLLQEPTAAAMYYAWKHGLSDGVFLVYDLGGGTFDVSVIRCLMGEYQVLGIHGDNYLGGDDFDKRFADHIRQHLVKQGYVLDLDIQNNADDATRFLVLTRIAQEVKEALSTSAFQYVGRRDIFKDQSGNSVTLDMEISREEWEEMMLPLVEQTIECCKHAVKLATDSSGVALNDINHVLLVGGSTRVPLVQKLVSEAFCSGATQATQTLQDEPDLCVSLGAAIHAANLGGLTLGDDASSVGVNIVSPLTTRRAKTRLTGRLTGASQSVFTRLGLVEDLGDGEENIYDCDIEDSRFKISDIPLPDPGTYPFKLALYTDTSDTPAISFPLALYRGSDVRSTGSALSNPSVLAKDIYLEVNRLGRPDRSLLLAQGTSLPVESRFRFFTADQSGAVILRLMQNHIPIRTVHLEVPKTTALGTPVDLKLHVDETMTMTAEGGVGDQVFWAQIEAPEQAQDRSRDEIETLLDDADHVISKLWGRDATYVQHQVSYLTSNIREAFRTDPDKLQVLARRLSALLDHYRSEDKQLTPSFDRFQGLINHVRRRVFRNADEESPLGLSADQWRDKLQKLEQEGTRAYTRRNQDDWGRMYSQVQAIWESLSQEDSRFSNSNSPEALKRRLQAIALVAEDMKESLALMVLSDNDETRKLQQGERLAILDSLNTDVLEPLRATQSESLSEVALRGKVETLQSTINALDRRLEHLPSLGLVSGS